MSADTDIQTTPFYLQSLVASVPGSTTPVTEFAAGADIQLSWDSNGTAFTLYAAKDAQPLYAGTDKSFVVKGGRTTATTFVLVASVTGGPDSGAPYPGFETITLTDALTVGISDPTITPASVTAGTLAVTGATTLAGVTAGDVTVGGTLTASGAATFSGGLTAQGLTVDGAATLSGGLTADTVTVSGAVGAASANLGAASASTLTVANWVSMLNPKALGLGGFSASSDGLVVANVGWPSDAGKKCETVAWAWTSIIGYVYATGGNNVMWTNGDSSTMAGYANSLVLPVPRGASFTVGVSQVSGNEVNAPTSFAWVPFGTNATLSDVSDETLAAAGFTAPVFSPTAAPAPFAPEQAISEIVAVVTEALGRSLEPSAETQLVSALQVLATHDPSAG